MLEEINIIENQHRRCWKTDKVCYTRQSSLHVINKVRKTRHKTPYKKMSTGKIPKRVYKCKFCGWFHTTSYLFKRSQYRYKLRKTMA